MLQTTNPIIAMNAGKLTPKQIASYHEDGFIIVPGLFDAEEIGLFVMAIILKEFGNFALNSWREKAGPLTISGSISLQPAWT